MGFKFSWLIVFYYLILTVGLVLNKENFIVAANANMNLMLAVSAAFILFGLVFCIRKKSDDSDTNKVIQGAYLPTPQTDALQNDLCNVGIDLPPKGNRKKIRNRYWVR